MNETTKQKIFQSRNEVADALYLLDTLIAKPEGITSIHVATARRQLSRAIAKLVSAESELSLIEERNRK